MFLSLEQGLCVPDVHRLLGEIGPYLWSDLRYHSGQ
jgi:hypothetical protein